MMLLRFAIAIPASILLLQQAAHSAQPRDTRLRAEVVAHGLGQSASTFTTAFVFVDHNTILAVERSQGRIYRLDLVPGQSVTPGAVVLDLDIVAPSPADGQSEYGVQSMARHPDFSNNGYIYIRYDQSPTSGQDTPQDSVTLGPNFNASQPTQNIIQRFVWDAAANAGEGALTPDAIIHSVTFDTRYHHGGRIAFDSSGHLYAGYGDLRHQAEGWVPGHSGLWMAANQANQQVSDPATVIRLNDDGTTPADNPFVGVKGAPRGAATWFAYGMRNPWGLAFDPATGTLWNTENGEAMFDEINRVTAGFNSGHSGLLGPALHPAQTGNTASLVNLPGSVYRDPEFSFRDTLGLTALHFAHGSRLGAAFDHLLLVGDFNTGNMWAFKLDPSRQFFTFLTPALQDLVDDRLVAESNPTGGEADEIYFGSGFGGPYQGILAMERGDDGYIYILCGNGELFRLRRRPADVVSDGVVNVNDLLAVIGHWGSCAEPCTPGEGTCDADIAPFGHGNCIVNVNDLLAVIGDWG